MFPVFFPTKKTFNFFHIFFFLENLFILHFICIQIDYQYDFQFRYKPAKEKINIEDRSKHETAEIKFKIYEFVVNNKLRLSVLIAFVCKLHNYQKMINAENRIYSKEKKL